MDRKEKENLFQLAGKKPLKRSLQLEKLDPEEGPECILPYSFYGNMGNLIAEGMDRRFFNRLGASHLERSICSVAGSVGYSYTMGGVMAQIQKKRSKRSYSSCGALTL